MEDKATTLKTEPIAGAPEAGQKKAGKKKAGKDFAAGDDVLLKVKHFHGYHATVTNNLGDGQYVVRINEPGHAGVLAQFSDDELVAATAEHLDQHNSTRLAYDYKD